jgi:hypothetical protein
MWRLSGDSRSLWLRFRTAESERWPEFSAIATCLTVAGVAGIPMRLADLTIGH